MDENAIESYPLRILIGAILLVLIMGTYSSFMHQVEPRIGEQRAREKLMDLCHVMIEMQRGYARNLSEPSPLGERRMVTVNVPHGVTYILGDGIWYTVGDRKQFLPCEVKIKGGEEMSGRWVLQENVTLESGAHTLTLELVHDAEGVFVMVR